jgi:ADP-heptose:LPS heptosyltransferase
MGDIVLTSPVVRCLKNQINGAEVHFLIRPEFIGIVNSNSYIDKVHGNWENLNDLIALLRQEHFDYIIDLQNNFKSGIIKIALGLPSFTLNKLNIKKYLLVNFKIDRLPRVHIVDRYLDNLSYFNVKNDNKGLDYFIPENEVFDKDELPSLFRNGYIAFVIGGTYNTKIFPEEKIIQICNRIEFPVILLGGPDEYNAGENIMTRSRGNVINFAGKTSLNQSASLVRDARIVLTNDTGLMHIAAAFKKKILSFWGNTVPEFGMYPYMADPSSKIMEVKNLKCRPCSKLGYRKCPKEHFMCMEKLDENEAVKWINENYYN